MNNHRLYLLGAVVALCVAGCVACLTGVGVVAAIAIAGAVFVAAMGLID